MSQTMRHPDLGDDVEVPDFAVPAFKERGYVAVDVEAAEPNGEHDHLSQHAAADTTSETAPAPGSDDGQPAVTPAG